MTPEQLLDALLAVPSLDGASVSPDGRWVEWSWLGVGPAADVYVAPTDGSAPPLRLTDTDDDTYVTSWSLDSRSVIVEQDHDGDERTGLYRVDLETPRRMIPLTDERPKYFLRGGELHPNGRWLFYGANFDPARRRVIEPTWLYRHDLSSGERRILARPQRGCYYEPELNPAGTHLIYTRSDRHPAGAQIWLVDVEGREDREILNFGDDVKVEAVWANDSERVLFVAEAGHYRKVGIWHRRDGSIRWLVDDPARNVESAFTPFGTRHAVLVETVEARTRASLLDLDSGRLTAAPVRPGELLPLAPVAQRGMVEPPGVWVAEYGSSRHFSDVVRLSLADGSIGISLTGVWDRTPLRPNDMVAAEDFRWRSDGGVEIQGWLYRARGPARGTIVRVHGGPTVHSADQADLEIQFLAARGFHVLAPNYRGSTGFRLAFQEAIKADGWGGREQEDIRSGIEALIRDGIAEPGRVGITGTSYGGYSAWHAITHFPVEVVAAAAPICGMTDLVVDYETTRPDLRPYSEEMMGGSPTQVPERYRERSPIHFVDRIRGRLLIVQGLQDPNVTPKNVREVQAALERHDISYEILTFKDEGHGISRQRNLRTLCLRLDRFFTFDK